MNIIINTSNRELQHQEEPKNIFAEFLGLIDLLKKYN